MAQNDLNETIKSKKRKYWNTFWERIQIVKEKNQAELTTFNYSAGFNAYKKSLFVFDYQNGKEFFCVFWMKMKPLKKKTK